MSTALKTGERWEAAGRFIHTTDGRPVAKVGLDSMRYAPLVTAAPQMLEALNLQHLAIDWLMARMIELDPKFMPTKSPAWPAMVAGNDAMKAATGSGS